MWWYIDTHEHKGIIEVASKVIILVLYFLFYGVTLNSSKPQFWKYILSLKWQIMLQYVIKRKWNNYYANFILNCCPLFRKAWLGTSPRGYSVIESSPIPRKLLHISYQTYHKHTHAACFVSSWMEYLWLKTKWPIEDNVNRFFFFGTFLNVGNLFSLRGVYLWFLWPLVSIIFSDFLSLIVVWVLIHL